MSVGRFLTLTDLNGETSVNIASALVPGNNSLKTRAWGKSGPSALVTFAGAAPTAGP